MKRSVYFGNFVFLMLFIIDFVLSDFDINYKTIIFKFFAGINAGILFYFLKGSKEVVKENKDNED